LLKKLKGIKLGKPLCSIQKSKFDNIWFISPNNNQGFQIEELENFSQSHQRQKVNQKH